jgi:hypothetical protein
VCPAAVIEFEGDRELEDLTKFIKENAKSKFELEVEAPTTDTKDAPADKEKDEKKDEL